MFLFPEGLAFGLFFQITAPLFHSLMLTQSKVDSQYSFRGSVCNLILSPSVCRILINHNRATTELAVVIVANSGIR